MANLPYGLQIRDSINMISTGYDGEIVGSSGLHQNWTNVTSSTGTSNVQYWYRDSDFGTNSNSSQVVLDITETYSATFDEDTRKFTVTVHSVINSIIRNDIRGNPGTYTRRISVARDRGGSEVWGKASDAIATAHTIATNIDLGTHTLVLNPDSGTGARSFIYYKAGYPSHWSDPVPSVYIDEFWMGTTFRNILPPDYRPGKIWNGSDWKSHDRSGGWAGVWDGSTFKQMRTDGGGTGTGNPPTIKHNDSFKNMRKIGTNQ